MTVPNTRLGHDVGSALVVAQFGLLAALFWMALAHGIAVSAVALGLAGLSVLLAAWTLAYNRLGNFNIHPQPRTGGQLVTGGPYAWVRHPMYSAVLLGAAALAAAAAGLLAWVLWFVLFAVLGVKALLEERWLVQIHPHYASYCTRSKRFIPWLF